MDDKYAALIQKLADKFGTTAEHLYGVLVAQAPISAFTDLFVSALMIAATFFAFGFISAKTRRPKETPENRYPKAEWESEGMFFAWMFFGILSLITTINVMLSINSVVTALLNPEYWAIKQIIG